MAIQITGEWGHLAALIGEVEGQKQVKLELPHLISFVLNGMHYLYRVRETKSETRMLFS